MGPTLAALIGAAPRAATAIRDRGRDIAYGELAARAARIAGGLGALGVKPGDRVALWLPNVSAWLELLLALAQIGAIAVAVNTRFRAVEVADIVGRSRARALVLWPGFKNIDFLGILETIDPAALDRLEAVIAYAEGEAPALLPGRGKRLLRYAALPRRRRSPRRRARRSPGRRSSRPRGPPRRRNSSSTRSAVWWTTRARLRRPWATARPTP